MNDVGFIAFGHKGKRFLLTSGLNGCFNVLIVSLYAAIGVHIPPRPVLTDDTLTGDQNVDFADRMTTAILLKNYHSVRQILWEGISRHFLTLLEATSRWVKR